MHTNKFISLSSPKRKKMERLLKNLMNEGVIKSSKVYNTMLQVDRGDFVDNDPYYDSPQLIGSNATISAPHMHAHALELLKDHLKPGNKVLDVGAGSGYLTVAFSKMMNDDGIVVGVEHIPDLVKQCINNISKSNKNLLDNGKIIIKEFDGRKGYPENAPYNSIHVGAAADEIPNDLIDQLALGGRMMIPVGRRFGLQYVYIIDKDMDGNIKKTPIVPVNYVPLTSVEKQISN